MKKKKLDHAIGHIQVYRQRGATSLIGNQLAIKSTLILNENSSSFWQIAKTESSRINKFTVIALFDVDYRWAFLLALRIILPTLIFNEPYEISRWFAFRINHPYYMVKVDAQSLIKFFTLSAEVLKCLLIFYKTLIETLNACSTVIPQSFIRTLEHRKNVF